MRQAYDYWQDQPGISRRVQTRSRQSLSPNRPALERSFSGRDVSQLSRSPGGDPTNNDLPVRRRIDARMSACGRRTDNEVSHETKFTSEGSEAVGFLLLAPRGTKTGLSPSRTEGRRESAVRSERTAGEETKPLPAKQFAVRRFPGHCAQCSATLSILTLM